MPAARRGPYPDQEDAMRIYVAEDSEDARDIMAATLSAGGYEDVNFSESGVELLARLGIDPVNPEAPEAEIIMLDVRMPGIDGIETCARIRADARYQYAPILMVTSLDDMETLNQAFVAGANDYINKPFNRLELHARLRNAQRLKGELDRRRARERELLAAQRGQSGRPQAGSGAFHSGTGLLSRQTMEAYIASGAAGEGVGVLALKVDRLKPYATNFGADAGAALLAQVGGAMRGLPARLGDLIAHFEPDVFVAVLPRGDQAALASLAQHARQAMRDLSAPQGGPKASGGVSVSIGAATGRDPRSSLAAAVSAMERAAHEGGDRIIFA
jgi:sigma-B regulation protein RsbU (phosphoserine phosphatase)